MQTCARIAAWAGLLVTLAVDAAGTVLYLGQSDLATIGALVWATTLSSSAAGLLVLHRHPRHRIGWLLLVQGPVVASVLWADAYLQHGWVDDPGSLPALGWVALWSQNSWPLLFLQVASIGYLFPDGRSLSPRWLRYQLVTSLAYPLLVVGDCFGGQHFDAPFAAIPSPLPSAPAVLRLALMVVGLPLLLGHLFGAAFSIRMRFRRAEGIARLQLLWFAWAALLIPVGLLVCFLDAALNGAATGLTLVAIAVGGTLVPVAIVVAIRRHQLFDIQLAVAKTLLYGGLATGVTGLYAAGVYGLGALMSNRGLAGFVAVVLVAVAVEPLRAVLRTRVERWVYGERADPYRALRRLGDRLEQTLAPADVLTTVVSTVLDTLRLDHVQLALAGPGGLQVVASAGWSVRSAVGSSVGSSVGRAVREVPVTYQGERMGVLAVEGELSDADEQLLAGLVRHAGVAVHAVRLSLDLQRSRERLVTAQEEERRRLRRDLHDGLGPELASIVMRLDAVRAMTSDERLSAVLLELTVQARNAVQDIRGLVEGLRPPALDEVGLVGALRQQAARLSDVPFVIDVQGPEPVPALPAAVEVAAYRIAVEAMTNVARHAQAHSCLVVVALNGHLEVVVSDNGRGVPLQHRAGVGLASMLERATEVGGTCTVSARAEGGTQVLAVLPVPS